MSTANSRLVLDWLRTWSVGKLDAIGRTDITSNMNLPLTSDVRVASAVTYMQGVRDDAEATAYPLMDGAWHHWQRAALWYDIKRSMPSDVRAVWDELWSDSDPNVILLFKQVIVACALLLFIDMAGG